MITRKKVVLKTKRSLEFLEKFEALEYVNNIGEIQEVWECNKTPILCDDIQCQKLLGQGYIIQAIPEGLIGNVEEFIDFCHNGGIECGEYISGQVFDTKQERCFLCEIANHKGFADGAMYNQFVEKTVDCIVYESENFFVIPELGALKQGYLMIVPKEHHLSVAQFPKDEKYIQEYLEVCKDLEVILKETFNCDSVTFMEHGSGPSGISSHKKSIVHAHTHVVVDFKLAGKYQDMVQLKPCDDIGVAKDVHYFSYQEGTDGQLMLSMDPRVYVQRQFPRQVMAEEMKLAPNQYNWRVCEFAENVDATLYFMYKFLKTRKSGRIYERTKAFVEGFERREKQ
jgi:diadenosine tetraphosphate (Ap4A) HIT family hydrolase